jgi:hypothetical protein
LAVATSADPASGAGLLTVALGAVLAAVGETGGAATENDRLALRASGPI